MHFTFIPLILRARHQRGDSSLHRIAAATLLVLGVKLMLEPRAEIRAPHAPRLTVSVDHDVAEGFFIRRMEQAGRDPDLDQHVSVTGPLLGGRVEQVV